MNKKIILLLSFLLINVYLLFSLKSNRRLPQEKEKFFIVNRPQEKKEKNKDQRESFSFSFLFLIIGVILLLIILVIILYIIYKFCQKSEDDSASEENLSSEEQSQVLHYPEISPEIAKISDFNQSPEQRKLFKGGIFITNTAIHIVLVDDPQQSNPFTIEEVLKKDIIDQQSLPKTTNKDFYKKIPPEKFQIILQEIANFFAKYLTGEFLTDVYQDYQVTSIDYGILTEMAKQFVKEEKNLVHKEYLVLLKNEEQEAPKEDLNKIDQDQYLDLLKDLLTRDQATFIKNKKNEKKHYLFLRIFKIYKFINQFFQDLNLFIQKHQDKYDPATLQKIQDDKKNLNNLIFKNNNHI